MNILVIANKPPFPPKDGGSLATLNMALGLVDNNIEVTILSLTTKKHPSSIEIIPEELKSKIKFVFLDIDIAFNVFSLAFNLLFSEKPYNIKRYYSKKTEILISNYILNNQFDVVQIEGLYLYYYLNAIKKVFKNKIIYRAHNVEHQIWKRSYFTHSNVLKTWYYNNLSKRIKCIETGISKHIDAMVSITPLDNNWFTENSFIKPSIVVPSGFNIKSYENKKLNKLCNSICFIGSLDWIPNQEGLIWFLDKVWPIVLGKNDDIHFHVAGKNAPKWLKTRFSKERNVIFFGEVENSSEFLDNYCISVVPLFSGSGMRIKIVELMFKNICIISTSKGAKGLDVLNQEHLLISDLPEQFANNISLLLNDKTLRANLSTKAYTFATNEFDINKLSLNLIEFYNKLANGN